MPVTDDNGIYYFLGNTVSHILHALPLHRELGGTFIVLSDKARIAVKKYGVPVINVNNKPYRWARFGYKIKPVHEYAVINNSLRKTTDFLNKSAKVVLFYDLFDFEESVRLTHPKTVFLAHGNMLKSYMSESNRLEIVKQYDYMAALGPYMKKRFIRDGIAPQKLIDVGVARTDEIVSDAGKIIVSDEMVTKAGIDPTKPIIAYLPTFWGASSIYGTGKEIMRHFPDDYTLLFRPHPQTPQKIINEYLDIIKTKSGNNIYMLEGCGDEIGLLDILRASSVIIGDISSVMLEAILTKKPLIFAQSNEIPDKLNTNYDSIKEVVNFSQNINSENAYNLREIISDAITHGIDSAIWNETIKTTFFHPDGLSVDAISKKITSQL